MEAVQTSLNRLIDISLQQESRKSKLAIRSDQVTFMFLACSNELDRLSRRCHYCAPITWPYIRVVIRLGIYPRFG